MLSAVSWWASAGGWQRQTGFCGPARVVMLEDWGWIIVFWRKAAQNMWARRKTILWRTRYICIHLVVRLVPLIEFCYFRKALVVWYCALFDGLRTAWERGERVTEEWSCTCVTNICTLQKEVTKICVFWRKRKTTLNFFGFRLELTELVITCLFWQSFETNGNRSRSFRVFICSCALLDVVKSRRDYENTVWNVWKTYFCFRWHR